MGAADTAVDDPERPLTGRTALVTGAGRGIGRCEALHLAELGATVCVNDVDADAARSAADEILGAGGTALVNDDDVSTWDGAGAAIDATISASATGHLDIVVNNAGILRDAMSFSMDAGQWNDVIGVHLTGHAACAHFAGRHWRGRAKAGETVSGRIVNTASESGLYGLAGQVNYAAAKAGIAAMTIVLARELGKYGVTVNAIAPRARTQMTESVLGDLTAGPGEFDEWDPANIAPVVAWLASDGAADVTGQLFVVNGDKIHLMEGWHRVGRIDNGGRRFTLDEIEGSRGALFGDRPTGVPVTGFGE